MKKIFISFGTYHNYKNSLERIKREALSLNFYDEIYIYTENDFDEKYLEKINNLWKIIKDMGFGNGNLILLKKLWRK